MDRSKRFVSFTVEEGDDEADRSGGGDEVEEEGDEDRIERLKSRGGGVVFLEPVVGRLEGGNMMV